MIKCIWVVLVDDVFEILNVVLWWDYLYGDIRICIMRLYGGLFYNDYDWVKMFNYYNCFNCKYDNWCYKVLVLYVWVMEIFFLVVKK